jgi:hypothetical protein
MQLKSAIFLLVLLCLAATSFGQILEKVNDRFDQAGTRTRVSKGIYWYSWLGYDRVLGRNSSLNIIDIDLEKAEVEFDFAWFNEPAERATLSEVADTALAIVAVNTAYFEKLDNGGYVSFHKSDGKVDQYVELPADHTRFWKHQAAFVQTGPRSFACIQGSQRLYDSLGYDNIVSSAPLLLSDGIPVGKYFVERKTGDKSDLEREHPDRHQAGLGPRTALGLTSDQHLLILTVDGRSPRARGINAEELTDLFQQYLGAYSAINMDGGGSITLFVRGATPTGVVNYPSDIRKSDIDRFEHAGQRRIGMALLVKPTREKDLRKMKALTVAADPFAKDYQDPKNQKK